jgi:hypothetical protein
MRRRATCEPPRAADTAGGMQTEGRLGKAAKGTHPRRCRPTRCRRWGRPCWTRRGGRRERKGCRTADASRVVGTIVGSYTDRACEASLGQEDTGRHRAALPCAAACRDAGRQSCTAQPERGDAACLAGVNVVAGLLIAVEAEDGDQGGAHLGGEEGHVGEGAGAGEEGVADGAHHKHDGLTTASGDAGREAECGAVGGVQGKWVRTSPPDGNASLGGTRQDASFRGRHLMETWR